MAGLHGVSNKRRSQEASKKEKKELEKIQSFSFSGENPHWIAFHKYPIEEQSKNEDKWKGTDLILQNLQTSVQLNLGNVAEYTQLTWTKKGDGLAVEAPRFRKGSGAKEDSSPASIFIILHSL